jgi:hypothetical protein
MLPDLRFSLLADNLTGGAFGEVLRDLKQVEGAVATTAQRITRLGASLRQMGAGLQNSVTRPLVDFAGGALREFDQVARTTAILNAQIETLGTIGGHSVEEVKALADELQRVTTFDGEDILQQVISPLATFAEVTGDEFRRAAAAALDLSTVLGGDVQAATMQIGKALQDPIRGITALTRSGVSFTDEQREQIKNLVQQNNLIEAQRVILSAIENQGIGGAAEAAANTPFGKIEQLKNAFGDLQAAIGQHIAPLLVPIVEAVTEAVRWFSQLPEPVQQVAVVMGVLAAALGPVLIALGGLVGAGGLLAGMGGGMAALAAVGGPIALLVAALGAAAAAGYAFAETADDITGWSESLKTAMAGGVDSITALSGTTKNLVSTMKLTKVAVVESMKEMGRVFESVTKLAPKTTEAVRKMAEKVALNSYVPDMAEIVVAEMTRMSTSMIDVGGTTAALTSDFKTMGEVVPESVRAIGEQTGAAAGDIAGTVTDGFFGWLEQGEFTFRSFAQMGLDVMRQMSSDILRQSLQPLQEGLSTALGGALGGAGGSGGIFSSLFSGLFGASSPAGSLIGGGLGALMPFADGGIVNAPSLFPMRQGVGLMGEAGPEVIAPLRRGADGRMGVGAVQPHVSFDVTVNSRDPDTTVSFRPSTRQNRRAARGIAGA